MGGEGDWGFERFRESPKRGEIGEELESREFYLPDLSLWEMSTIPAT